jgi:hypothetical protein
MDITNNPSIDTQVNTPDYETATSSNRKKLKKRDRSPPTSDTLPSGSTSIGATATVESNEANTATTANANNVALGQKKEKQRPETWNKIEQQIFYNALRQVRKEIYFISFKTKIYF